MFFSLQKYTFDGITISMVKYDVQKSDSGVNSVLTKYVVIYFAFVGQNSLYSNGAMPIHIGHNYDKKS